MSVAELAESCSDECDSVQGQSITRSGCLRARLSNEQVGEEPAPQRASRLSIPPANVETHRRLRICDEQSGLAQGKLALIGGKIEGIVINRNRSTKRLRL